MVDKKISDLPEITQAADTDLFEISQDSGGGSFASKKIKAAAVVPADLDILLAELALGLADALNVAQFLGDAGNRFADSFDALTYVNTGGSTNLDTSEAGTLKPTAAAGGTETSGAPSGQGAAGYTIMDRSWAVNNSATVTKIGVNKTTSGTVVVKLFKRNAAGDYDVVVSESFSHGGTGWEDFTLSAPYAVPATGTYYAGAYSAGTWGYIASTLRAYKIGDITGSGQTGFTEDTQNAAVVRVEYQDTVNSMTALSAALTAAAAPAEMRVVSRVEFVDAITLGTDLTYEVSRDNGTTWTAATMNDRFTAGGLHVLESGAVNVSGQPSGTQVKWRIKTFNNKMAEIKDVYVYWV